MSTGSVVVSAGVGSGVASLSCDACAARRDASASGLFRLGVALRPTMLLSGEASGWSGKFTDATGSASARLLFINTTLQWYPRLTSGLFVKAGGGFATFTDDVTIATLGPTAIRRTGPGLVIGAGWNLPLRGQWGLTPYADVNYAMSSGQSVNGLSSGNKLGGNLLHFGVAATFGGRATAPEPPPVIARVNQDSIDRVERTRLDSLASERRRQEERDRLASDSVARAREAAAAAAREAEAVRASEVLRVTLVTALYFDFDKAQLRQDSKQALDAKVPILLANSDVRIRIVGHTDDRGTEAVNRKLGRQRAVAARDYLAARGVDVSRIEIADVGKSRPVCGSPDESCRARNRRTEFELTGGATILRKP
jgi:peptidoglycan-associated lipoprotein